MKLSLKIWCIGLSYLMIFYSVGVPLEIYINSTSRDISELRVKNGQLVNSINYMTEIKKQLHDEPIYEWPIKIEDYTKMTSAFGIRDNPLKASIGGGTTTEHQGIDLKGTYQARVIAIADGVVIEHWLPPGVHYGKVYEGHPVLGGMIKIRNNDGTYAIYGHLSETYVSEYGTKSIVKAGDVIGRQGNTGMSTGSHLHFELHNENDEPIQPLLYLKNPETYYISTNKEEE